MKTNENQKSTREHKVYIHRLKTWVEVTEEQYYAYYRDIWATRKRAQAHGQCMCPKSKTWMCDGDCLVCEFRAAGDNLSLDYTVEDGEGNRNEIIRHKSLLPSESQRLTEAAIIRLSDLSLQVIEKKYEVNGEKTNYFSFLFLKCSAHMSHKSKLSIVSRAVESVQKDGFDDTERYEKQMRAKSIIQEELEEKGGFTVEEIADKIFEEEPELKVAFQDKMEKYDMVKEEVLPQSENTVRKFQSQHLFTDTGIEIKIPMEQYKNPRSVEFITNPDGTVSVLIKNIEHLEAKL